MDERRGERLGWTGGWLGSFSWVAVLAVVFLVQGKWVAGLLGIGLATLAMASTTVFAPWTHPTTPYARLMAVPYMLLFAAIPWSIWAFGGLAESGLTWWNALLLMPLLTPLLILGRRTWEGDARQESAEEPVD